MISKKMQSAINDQINAELWSAYLYLAMSMQAEAMALKGIANWFNVQWREEQDHAAIFEKFLNDVNGRVELKPIASVPRDWDSPLDMFKDTLDHEIEVTALIHDLAKLAFHEGDLAAMSRLQWFIDEQVEEEANATELVTLFQRAGKDFIALDELDRRLAKRCYKKPDVLE